MVGGDHNTELQELEEVVGQVVFLELGKILSDSHSWMSDEAMPMPHDGEPAEHKLQFEFSKKQFSIRKSRKNGSETASTRKQDVAKF